MKVEHLEQGAVHHRRAGRFHPGSQPQDLGLSFAAGGAAPVVQDANHFVIGGANRSLELIEQQALRLVADVIGDAVAGMFLRKGHQAFGNR